MFLKDIYHGRARPGPERVEMIKRAIAEMLSDSAFSGEAIFSLPFGDKRYTFPNTLLSDDGKYQEPTFLGWSPRAKKFLADKGLLYAPGDLPISCHVHGFGVPCSVVLVTGRGNVGKTPFAHAMAERVSEGDADGFGLLRYGEPFAGYLKTEYEAGCELANLVATYRVVVIDSMKDLLTDMSGQAMESGLARKSVSMLSRLAMTASEIGCTIIIPINPSSSKDSISELITEIARSNVGMAAINNNGNWFLISREGEGKMRLEGSAELTFPNDMPKVDFRALTTATEEQANVILSTFESAVDAPIDDILGVARRLANRSN